MENDQSILDATEYILMALNNISNYNEFLEYKQELIKAILDIRKLITNSIRKNKNKLIKSSNTNNISYLNSDNDKEKTSYLSKMLGLKFNYDPYFNENQLRNLTQNEEIMKNNLINNPNYINNENNKNNIGYNKSLRNKFRTNNNIKPKNKNNIINRLYPTDNNNYSPKKNKNKKEKLSLIADIIMKINNEDYIFEILTKLYGEDLTDKLMSSDVSDDLLEAIQNSIEEIESLKNKDSSNIYNKNNNEEVEEMPKKFPVDKLMSTKIKRDIKRSQSSKRFNNGMNKNNIYKEFNFIKSLRKNPGINNYGINDCKTLNNSKYIRKEKPFINATNPYGNYFDAPLQKGGLSKLNVYKNIINA